MSEATITKQIIIENQNEQFRIETIINDGETRTSIVRLGVDSMGRPYQTSVIARIPLSELEYIINLFSNHLSCVRENSE